MSFLLISSLKHRLNSVTLHGCSCSIAASRIWTDSSFKNFTSYLRPNDVVVVNNSRVIPARLIGHREETGGQVEIFLVREIETGVWEALVRPGARLKKGARAVFGNGRLFAEMLDEPGAELRHVRFHCEGSFEEALAEVGSTPLPPYIKRPAGISAEDRERYQTVYSKPRGAIAAPTAGLHFTPTVLAEVARVASLAEVTLHVGYGTFEPVRVDEVDQHSVSSEHFEISDAAAQTINRRTRKRRKDHRRWDHHDASARIVCDRRRQSCGRTRRGQSDDQTRLSISHCRCTADKLSPAALFAADSRQRLCGAGACAERVPSRRRAAVSFLQLRRLHVNPVGR